MVGSMRRGAVVVALAGVGLALAWVGLASSQQTDEPPADASDMVSEHVPADASSAPTTIPAVAPAQSSDEFVRVNENGTSRLCRIVTRWRLENGTLAYQVQVVETGEMLTIMEDGPATQVKQQGNRMKAMSMKIFHWARATTPPGGAPVPPLEGVMPADHAIADSGPPCGPCESAAPPIVIGEGPSVLVDMTTGQALPGPVVEPPGTHEVVEGPSNHVMPMPQGSSMGLQDYPTGGTPYVGASTPHVRNGHYIFSGSRRMPSANGANGMDSMVMASDGMEQSPEYMQNGQNMSRQPRTLGATLRRMVGRDVPRTASNGASTQQASPFSTAMVQPGSPAAAAEMRTPSMSGAATAFGTPSASGAMSASGMSNALPDPGAFGPKTAGTSAAPGQSTVEQSPYPFSPQSPGQNTAAAQAGQPLAQLPSPGASRTGEPSGRTGADDKSGDILLQPDRFGGASKREGVQKAGFQPQGAAPITQVGGSQVPMGVQSVLAAKNGVYGQITYMPVPIVTVPQPYTPPMPPPPALPQAPDPLGQNAFTPPREPKEQQKPRIEVGLPMGNRGTYLPPPSDAQTSMFPGYGYGYPPATYPGVMPAQYQPMPYASMPYGQTQQYAYGPVRPDGQRSVVPLNYMASYSGPQAPSPAANQPFAPRPPASHPYPAVNPAYAAMMPPPGAQMPPPYMQPPMQGPMPVPPAAGLATVSDQSAPQLMATLRDSLYPAQREMAADSLAARVTRDQPQVLEALVHAARNDPAASVRAGCCRSLARLKLNAEPVVGTLTALRADSDPRVRVEAEQALVQLTGAAIPPSTSGAIQPARGQ